MISSLILYWFFTLYRICNFFIIMSVISLIVVCIYFIILLSMHGAACSVDEKKEANKVHKDCTSPFITLAIIAMSVIFLTLFVPKKKELAIIYVLPKIAQNKDIQAIPPNIAKLANEGLKELIEFVKDEAKTIKE